MNETEKKEITEIQNQLTAFLIKFRDEHKAKGNFEQNYEMLSHIYVAMAELSTAKEAK